MSDPPLPPPGTRGGHLGALQALEGLRSQRDEQLAQINAEVGDSINIIAAVNKLIARSKRVTELEQAIAYVGKARGLSETETDKILVAMMR